jgi:hypothetical protein
MLGPEKLVEANTCHQTTRLAITRELIAQRPKSSHIWSLFHGGVAGSRAFGDLRFSTSDAFTVEICAAPADLLWRKMRDKRRNVIRRALTNLQVGNRHDVEVFISFCQDKLRGRGLRNYCQRSYCQRDIAECIARGFGRLLVASDPAARPAILTALDQKIEYFPVSTRRMRCENAAVSLVVRAALTGARKTEPGSDLNAIVQESNTRLLTSFGSEPKLRHIMSERTVNYQISQYTKELIQQCFMRPGFSQRTRQSALW